MEVDWFELITEPDGSQHVIQVKDEKDKNHGPQDTTATNEAKMYSIPGKFNFFLSGIKFKHRKSKINLLQITQKFVQYISDSDLCLVTFFKLYTSKLNPDCPALWQKPRRARLHYNDPLWFEPRHVGHDPLECFMKFMANDIKLNDLTYTNHCIRSTVLNEVGGKFKVRPACALSGHKNESSIR